jgi:hypothetical protein
MKRNLCVSALTATLAMLACSVGAVAQVRPISGQFALQGDSPKTNGYLTLKPIAGNPLSERLDFWMTDQGSSQPIKNYLVEMTKKLHMVIVSDDFKTFLHVHPELSANGHFLLNQPFPAPGKYQIYADGEPNNLNHQVFRFEVTVGKAGGPAVRTINPTGLGVNVGPYEVDLSTLKLRAGNMDMVDVEILKNGQPAKDLHPYLGSPAHAVFLNTQDLSYVHVHPMPMGEPGSMDMNMNMSAAMNAPAMPENGPSSPDMMLHVSIKEPGIYKMWLQFRGGDQLYVAEFAMSAK